MELQNVIMIDFLHDVDFTFEKLYIFLDHGLVDNLDGVLLAVALGSSFHNNGETSRACT